MSKYYFSSPTPMNRGLVLMLLLMTIATNTAMAYEYEASGNFEFKQHFAKGESNSGKSAFKVYVRDCNWLIHVENIDPPVKDQYWEKGFDGRYQYTIGSVPFEQSNYWAGAIGPDQVPFFRPIPTLPVIWFALADSCFLNKDSKLFVPPFSTEIVRPPIEVNITRHAGPVQLLETAIFIDDGYDYRWPEAKKWQAPYDKGFTNAIYSTGQFTNVDGIEVPLDFQLSVFMPIGNDIGVSMEYHGHVTSLVSKCSISDFVPKVPWPSDGHMNDFRFTDLSAKAPQAFTYETARWLSKDEAEQMPNFASYKKTQPALKDFAPILVKSADNENQSASHRAKSITVLALLSLITTFPLIILYSRWKKSKHM